MDAVAPFSFNPATSFSDSLNNMFNILNNVKQVSCYQPDETLSRSWMSQPAMEDGQQRMMGSGLDVSPVLASRSISGDAGKNPLAQFLPPLQLAPPVLPPQSAYMSATMAQTAAAFTMPFPLAPNALNRSCSLEYPAQPSAADIPLPIALSLSPSSSVDTTAANSPNPALPSAAASVAESDSDEEEFKVKCERQIEADRQHNILAAKAVASQLGMSPQSEGAPMEEKVRRGRRRKGESQSDESQERRRRRRLDSHMRYDRHRREVLQNIFTDLRSLVYSANEVAETSNQTLQTCKPALKTENGANASSSSVHESMDSSIFLRNFSREDLEKLSVCDLLSVTHRCLRSLNQIKSKLENRIQQMEMESENENEKEKEKDKEMDMAKVKDEEGGNSSSPAVAVDTQTADPMLSSLFYYPIGYTMYTRVD